MFSLIWTEDAEKQYAKLKEAAEKTLKNRKSKKKTKSTPQEGLFKQVHKTIQLLKENPKHPSLQTHEFTSIDNPYEPKKGKVFEAYAQQNTPGAYRIFWCYGPDKKEITIISITPHP